MSNELIAIRGGDFSGTAARADTTIAVFLKGNADSAAFEAVAKLFSRVHDEAQRAATVEAVVDLRELDFMNSTCLKSLVTWISNVQRLDPARRYRIRFVASAAIHWQKRSLDALRCFATDLITVDGMSIGE